MKEIKSHIKKKILIVKVEIREDQKSILIYNHSREYTWLIEDPTRIDVIVKFMKGVTSGYYKAAYTENRRRFQLIEKVMDQIW